MAERRPLWTEGWENSPEKGADGTSRTHGTKPPPSWRRRVTRRTFLSAAVGAGIGLTAGASKEEIYERTRDLLIEDERARYELLVGHLQDPVVIAAGKLEILAGVSSYTVPGRSRYEAGINNEARRFDTEVGMQNPIILEEGDDIFLLTSDWYTAADYTLIQKDTSVGIWSEASSRYEMATLETAERSFPAFRQAVNLDRLFIYPNLAFRLGTYDLNDSQGLVPVGMKTRTV